MSGIYIPGMEMPASCWACPLVNEDVCGATDYTISRNHWKDRADTCHLVEMKDGYLYGVKDGILYEAMLKDPSKGAKTITVNLPPKEE